MFTPKEIVLSMQSAKNNPFLGDLSIDIKNRSGNEQMKEIKKHRLRGRCTMKCWEISGKNTNIQILIESIRKGDKEEWLLITK